MALDDSALQTVKTGEELRTLFSENTRPARDESAQHVYPHWPWNPVFQAIRSVFLECIAMPLVRFLAKPAVRVAVDHWPSSPMLIVSNHVTSYDVPFMLYALPGRVRRRVAVAMSAEMMLDWRRGRNQGNWFLNLVAPIEYLLVTGLFNVFPLPQMSGFRRQFCACRRSRRSRLQRDRVSRRTTFRRRYSGFIQAGRGTALERTRNASIAGAFGRTRRDQG